MSDIDFEHISHLFSIIEGCAQHTGKFGSIQTEAFNRLQEINQGFRDQQMQRKAADDEQARAQAEIDAQHAAEDHEEEEPASTTTLADRRI